MRAGKLDRVITLQRKTVTISDSGEPIEGWAVLALRRPASMKPVSGTERWVQPSLVADQQVEFQIRYSDDVADLSPLDRIIFPALATGAEVVGADMIYNILVVQEIGRQDGLQVITRRRPDTGTN